MKAALYARFSTDRQSENSLPDQFRVCERLAGQHGFEVVARFQDAAISGGTVQRPGYQSLLTGARNGHFDVIVAEDTSRLWRNMAEQSPRLAELRDIGIAVVTHDLDTRQESSAILGAVTGAMADHYRAEIGRRTRRGLEGRARQQKLTGGRAYGYRQVDGRRIVDEDQATVVREIFERYAGGESALSIAADLNKRRIPSPGAAWKRELRRRGGWVASCIVGDPNRGVGIVNNDLYRGLVIWNRSRWVRAATDGKRRRRVINPRSQWVEHADESIRIVPEALWKAVKRRQAEQTTRVGSRISAGLSKSQALRTGRQPRYLFSGMLKCGLCGSTYTLADARTYQCASYVNGRACTNAKRVKRTEVETKLLAGIKEDLLNPTVIAELVRRIRAALRSRPKFDHVKRLDSLRAEVTRLADAIAQGLLSRAVAERLREAEAELAHIEAEAARPDVDVAALLPGLPEFCRRLVAEIEKNAERDPVGARQAIRSVIPEQIILRPENGRLVAEIGIVPVQLTGTDAGMYGSGGRI